MHRILIVLVAACGTTTDTRPETAAYVTEAILAPNCGTASCHSSAAASRGYVFDTVANAHQTLLELVDPGHADRSQLIDVLTGSRRVMPPDQALPDADITLLTNWIDDGASGL